VVSKLFVQTGVAGSTAFVVYRAMAGVFVIVVYTCMAGFR
jgi:hypothetical protein